LLSTGKNTERNITRGLSYAKETGYVKSLIMELLSDKGKITHGRRLAIF